MGHFGTDMTPASWLERIFGGPERTESYTHDLGRAKCDFLARGQGVILCGLLTQGTMTPAEAEGALENFCLRYIGQDGQETFVTLEH